MFGIKNDEDANYFFGGVRASRCQGNGSHLGFQSAQYGTHQAKTFLLYFFGEKVDFSPHFFETNLPFPQQNIIKKLHSTKLKKLLYVS